MGGKESKSFPITTEEAVRRVSKVEERRLQDTFRRLSSSSNGLSKNHFIRSVLGEGLPAPLGEAIFNLCGGNAKSSGLNFKEVLTVLVLITKGTKEEKVKFIFGLLSNESNSYIERGDLIRFLKDWETDFDSKVISSLFQENDKVTFDAFSKWLDTHPHSLGVAEWLLHPNSNLSLLNKHDTPTFYQTLSGVTHLEEQEIIELEKRFWNLIGSSNSGRIDLSVVHPLISPPLPANLVSSFFSAFDENQDGHIDFKELSCGVSAACRGPEMERQKFVFKIFDTDRDGFLNKSEIEVMCQCLVDVRSQTLPLNSTEIGTPDQLVSEILEKHDPLGKGGLSAEEYLVWTVNNPYPQDFSKLIFQLCHIVLGLRPFSRKDEGEIVKGWIEHESRVPMTVGSVWHLINIDWWTNWQNYISHQDSPLSSRLASADVTKRGSKRALDATVATDADGRTVVGTSYQQITEGASSSSSPARQFDVSSQHSSSNCSSPQSSRKNSASSSSNNNGSPPARPGLIDNSHLIQAAPHKVTSLTAEGGKLKTSIKLVRGKEFELIPERLWRALVQWYGGSPSLPRQVIRNIHGEIELELNPLSVKIMKHQTITRPQNNMSTAYSVSSSISSSLPTMSPYGSSAPTIKRYHAYQAAFSRRTTVKQIVVFLSQRLHMKLEDIRMWYYRDENHMDLLEDETQNLEDIGLRDEDSLLVEVRSRDGTWPEEITSLCSSSNSNSSTNNTNNDRRLSVLNSQLATPGITGLNNLGNTCYMNASLQCVSSTKILSEYFKSNCHLFELNRTNPLGMKGHVAKRFGDLVKDMWASDSKTIAPIRLRYTIGRYRPHFAGFQQQDAQELLAFMLEGLHEDLNRVTDQPYTELKDSDGRPDVEVADEAWENHILRNKSIIVDLFHGQLKSKVTCKVCSHESVKFDPFTYLPMPLPMESSIHIEIVVIRQDGSVPVKFGLTLDMESRYSSIKTHLSKLCNIQPQNLILVDIVQSQFRSIPPEEQKLKGLNGSCIFAYEFYPLQCGAKSQKQIIQTFPEIQRNASAKTAPYQKLNDSAPSSEAAKKESKKLHSEGKREASLTTVPNNMGQQNGATTTTTSVRISAFSSEDFEHHSHHDPAKSSDKVALLPNGDPPSLKMDSLTLPDPTPSKSENNHSRQGSTCSSFESQSSSLSSSGEIGDCQQGVLVALHRKMMPQEVYFLSMEKYRPVLFGNPLIVACTNQTTHQDLYQSVWLQVSRLVSPLPPRDSTHNHATDCDDSLRYEYPFTLKIVQRDGSWCSRCPWHRSCRGCTLACGSELFNFSSSYLAIDWDQTALHLRYQSAQERAFIEDKSVSQSHRAASEPITLKKCLESFTREEELGDDEKYYCTRCKTHQLASKKLQIWRLPPILIIHLKRFHLLNGRWIKSHKIVDFPLHSLDPTDYLAAIPSTTLKRYKSLKRGPLPGMFNGGGGGAIAEVSEPNSLEMEESSSSSSLRRTNNDVLIQSESGRTRENFTFPVKIDEISAVDEEEEEENDNNFQSDTTTVSSPFANMDAAELKKMRRRLESTSLANDPIKDDNLQDFHQHRLNKGSNSLDIKYNLYSMVCHSGVLSGGHYISYGKSKAEKWYCQNDSTCKEIPEDQVDKSTAYLLFYERENLSVEDYLPKVEGAAPDTKDLEEELESDFKKQCSLM